MDRQKVKIEIRDERLGQTIPIPFKATPGAAGYDLHAAIELPIYIPSGRRAVIPCGFSVELPPGFEMQIRPRSGLALDHGLTVLNAPGTIDPDYRGEVKVILINLGDEEVCVNVGARIAQAVVSRYETVDFDHHQKLSATERGENGFGSTGTGPLKE